MQMNPYMLPGVPHSSGMPAGGMPLAMPGGASMEEVRMAWSVRAARVCLQLGVGVQLGLGQS